MRRLVPAVLLLLALAGCGSTTSPADGPTSTPTSAAPSSSPTPSGDRAALARRLVAAFQAAGLPAANPRDNTGSCAAGFDCTALITTDDVSVYTFATQQKASRLARVGGVGDSYRNGIIVLSNAAARTPESQRRAYEQVLERNCPNPCAPPGDPAPTGTRSRRFR